MADVRSADEQTLADARRIIADGGLVVIPTDTVYGIACDPCNAAAIARIYAAKHRPADKALQVIMPDLSVLPKPRSCASHAARCIGSPFPARRVLADCRG